jgi:hypothetical protein
LSLPIGLSALGTITSQALRYPQPEEKESSEKLLRGLDNNALERIMIANKENRNELIMATVGIMNSARHILGITVLTRRVNVVPNLPDETDKIEDIADKSDGTAAKKSDSSADSKSKTGASSESSDAKNKESKKDDSKKDSHEKSGTDKK